MATVTKLPRRASEETFNELHKLLTEEYLIKIQSGEATTADLKAAGDWLFKNDITGIAIDNSAKDRAVKKSGGKPSDYSYNKKTNTTKKKK